jgi:small subunit ribosomal protein YMR-31
MAPKEVADHFQSFLAKLQSTSSSPSNPSSNPKTQTPKDSAQGKVDRTTESESEKEDVWKGKPEPPVDFENYWEAPESLWKQKEWSEREIEAIMVCSFRHPSQSGVFADLQSGGATEIRSGP